MLRPEGKIGLFEIFNKRENSRVNAMIPEIRKILYVTDLSDNSAYAFRHAVDFAEKYNAKIIILHVLQDLPFYAQGAVQSYFTEEEKKRFSDEAISHLVELIRKRLKVFCEKELRNIPETTNRIESIGVFRGYPANEILKKVDELECDAIVMGTHGKGIIRDTYLGSMTKKILRRVRKSVFVIPLPKDESDITFHDV